MYGQSITDQQSKVFSNQIPLDSVQSLEVISGAPPAEFGDAFAPTERTEHDVTPGGGGQGGEDEIGIEGLRHWYNHTVV